MVPYWAIYFTLVPKKCRPRESWSMRQIINVKFTRRIYKVTEVAGVTWGTRDPQKEPPVGSLKETRFEWAEPLPEPLRTGILASGVPFTRVGCFIWPKDSLLEMETYKDVEEGDSGDIPVIGIFMHGGAYCHMSAHESARTSRIPRRLIKDQMVSEVYSVEYRLLQHAPFPAAIQDAATVYARVVERYRNRAVGRRKIVLIGDSSGGNLVLALARWLRDEGTLPMPDGLLLLSPSCDVSHALPENIAVYVPRPNAETDYLTDTPDHRELLQRTFLGFNPSCVDQEERRRLLAIAHSEYVSPCSPRVLQEWSHSYPDHGSDATPQELASDPTSPSRPLAKFKKLFENFPRTLLVVGDAERLVTEVKCLQQAMEKDGVDIRTEWVEDAVHDVLIIADGWWDARVIKKTWQVIEEWIAGFQKA
ncbi:hypothetical protein C0991_010392 [Blastosporella zonata]|nr:hypothetical protein C0991_010392 [Blastosporella zonata]